MKYQELDLTDIYCLIICCVISKIFHKTLIDEGDGIHTNIQTTNSFVFIKVLYKYYHIYKMFLKIV